MKADRTDEQERTSLALCAADMGVWDWDPVADTLYWDDQVARLHGVDPDTFDGRMSSFLAQVHPDDRDALESSIGEALRTGEPFLVEFRVVDRSGHTAWIQGRGRAYLDGAGQPVRMIGVGLDTTALHSLRERAGRSLDHISDGLVMFDRDWRVIYLNEQGACLVGARRDEIVGRVAPQDFPQFTESVFWERYQEAMRTQEPQSFEAQAEHNDRWFEVRAFPAPDGLTVFFRNIDDRRKAEEERGRLLRAEQAARAEAERSRQRLAFVADASKVLAGSLDRGQVLDSLVRLAVPAMADWAAVYLPSAEGLHQGAASPDPGQGAQLIQAGTSIVHDAYRTGSPILLTTDEVRAVANEDPALGAQMAALGASAGMVLPLSASGEVCGVMVLLARQQRTVTIDDLITAGEVVTRGALALINAKLYERERQVADALQQAVLPVELPTVPGFDIAARYRAATAQIEVGGDWYDAFCLPDGRMCVAVGDVAGHGLRAAALMGQLRNALRAYAVVDPSPPAVLVALDQLLTQLEPEAMATILYGVLDPETATLTWASAGHPPPVLVEQEHDAHLLDSVPSPPVGTLGAVEAPEPRVLHLQPDTLVLWYTDGLIERRDAGVHDRLEVLRRTASSLDDATADQACVRVLEALVTGEGSTDDACILALRRRG